MHSALRNKCNKKCVKAKQCDKERQEIREKFGHMRLLGNLESTEWTFQVRGSRTNTQLPAEGVFTHFTGKSDKPHPSYKHLLSEHRHTRESEVLLLSKAFHVIAANWHTVLHKLTLDLSLFKNMYEKQDAGPVFTGVRYPYKVKKNQNCLFISFCTAYDKLLMLIG